MPHEKADIDAAQTKSTASAKVTTMVASKPKMKLTKVCNLAKLSNYFSPYIARSLWHLIYSVPDP